MFGVKNEPQQRQMMVILRDDGTADLASVVDVSSERVLAEGSDGEYAVPVGDLRSYTTQSGRVWVYPSTLENVTDCQRIAALERSTVLQQITRFRDDSAPAGRLPLGKLALIAAGVVLLIVLVAML